MKYDTERGRISEINTLTKKVEEVRNKIEDAERRRDL
jgi:hypothetical protein